MLIPFIIILLIIYFSINSIYAFQYVNWISKKNSNPDLLFIGWGFFLMFMFGLLIKFYSKFMVD